MQALRSRCCAHPLAVRSSQLRAHPRALSLRPRALSEHGSIGFPQDTTVQFSITKEVGFGGYVLVVGSHSSLGSWDPNKALELSWSEGHNWLGQTSLPRGSKLEYKYMVKEPDGSKTWMDGDNIALQLPAQTLEVFVEDSWDKAMHNATVLDAEGIPWKMLPLNLRELDKVAASLVPANGNGSLGSSSSRSYSRSYGSYSTGNGVVPIPALPDNDAQPGVEVGAGQASKATAADLPTNESWRPRFAPRKASLLRSQANK